MTEDFLIEIGCEELPPNTLKPLAQAFADEVNKGLQQAQLSFNRVSWFASPRRLAVKVSQLQQLQADRVIERRGPAVKAAFDEAGNPTKAALGFARSCQVEFEQLGRITTDKGEWLAYQAEQTGKSVFELMPDIINAALAKLPISKPMRWGDGDAEFVRPVHWVVMLYGDKIIDATVLGIATSNQTHGHRFHRPQALAIRHPNDYEQVLHDGCVIVDFAKRQQLICEQIKQLAQSINGDAVMPQALLDEVTAIVEWPQALLAKFDDSFLQVPAEALIAAMQGHQKSFALKDNQGKLMPHFITVANIASKNPAQVIAGNEKVMTARLSDAAFFYQQDTAHPLEQLIERTKSVVFQKELGSIYDKTGRMKQTAEPLALAWQVDNAIVNRAISLSKCDLMSEMVGEFPELQGTMGYYYASHDNEEKQVATALADHYLPKFSGDQLPQDDISRIISLVDRLDTLVGIFAIGQKPSGVKDPFKLRRHALAIVRILTDKPLLIPLTKLIELALASYDKQFEQADLIKDIHDFILDRLVAWYHGQGVSHELINATKARQSEDLHDFSLRLEAVTQFMQLSQASALAKANKRVSKLLTSAAISVNGQFNLDQFELEQEQALANQIIAAEKQVDELIKQQRYVDILQVLAGLDVAVDQFFEHVMVMDENEAIRKNRLNLLARLRQSFLHVADISLL